MTPLKWDHMRLMNFITQISENMFVVYRSKDFLDNHVNDEIL